MALSNKEKQAAFRARKAALGLVQVTGLVPQEHASAVAIIMQMLRDNPDLEIGTLRDRKTGRLVRAR